MDTALLVGLSRQMAARRNMEVVANNLANMTTTAFKSESVLFEEYLVNVTNEDGTTEQVSMVLDTGVNLNMGQGRLEPTGNPFDVAINGEGFFEIETDQGLFYTRNGQFRTNEEGVLVTQDGETVLSMDGREIVLPTEGMSPQIARDGTISDGDGLPLGRLNVVTFENTDRLEKIGNGLYRSDEEPIELEEVTVLQGTLEMSNVVPILEMTRMMDISRSYVSISKMIEKSDDMTRDTIRRLVDTNA